MPSFLSGRQRNRIVICLLFFVIVFPAAGYALCQVTLQWVADDPAVQGYYVFGREEGQEYDYDNPWWQGDHSFAKCLIEELDEDKVYYFVIRAHDGSNTSTDSNEVRFIYEDNSSAVEDNSGAVDDNPGAVDDNPGADDDNPGADDDNPGADDDNSGADTNPSSLSNGDSISQGGSSGGLLPSCFIASAWGSE